MRTYSILTNLLNVDSIEFIGPSSFMKDYNSWYHELKKPEGQVNFYIRFILKYLSELASIYQACFR